MKEDIVCRGCWALGNNCGLCSKCISTRPSPPPLMSWMLCCNHANGEFAGKIEAATFEYGGDSALVEMEGPELNVRFCGDEERVEFKGRYKAAPHMLKVYGKGRLPVWRRRRNIGNMLWDEIGVAVLDGVHLLRWLAIAGWLMTAAPDDLFDAFRDNDVYEVGVEEWSAAIMRAMGVP